MTLLTTTLGYMLSLLPAREVQATKSSNCESLVIHALPQHLRRDLGLEGLDQVPPDRIIPAERKLFP